MVANQDKIEKNTARNSISRNNSKSENKFINSNNNHNKGFNNTKNDNKYGRSSNKNNTKAKSMTKETLTLILLKVTGTTRKKT